VPALLAFALWYSLQYQQYGWVFNNPTGPWAGLAGLADPLTYVRNLAISAWRLADLGQLVVYLGLMAMVLIPALRHRLQGQPMRPVLMSIWILSTLGLVLVLAAFRNPAGHRYLLMTMLMGQLWLSYEVAMAGKFGLYLQRMAMYAFFLLIGHWVILLYPDAWARGWDASLCHLPAGPLKRELAAYLSAKAISPAQVAAYYPDQDGPYYALLQGTTTPFADPLADTSRYILTTNATNDLEPEVLGRIEESTHLLVRWDRWPVWVELREKN